MTRETILIVDDDARNVEFLRDSLLVPSGYRALCACDGAEALQLARSEHPDLILLDLQMPKMDGFDVLEALADEGKEIPTILITAHGSETVAAQAFRLGVRDYFPKPFKVTEVMKAIERSLAEARLRREKEVLSQKVERANSQLGQRLKELNILYGISKSVTSLLDLESLLLRIVEATAYVIGAEEISLYLLDEATQELELRAVQSAGDRRARSIRRRADSAVVRQVMKTGRVALLQSPRTRKTDPLQTTLAVPLKARSGTIGVLHASNSAAMEPFSDNDQYLLSVLADYAAIALENARLFAEVEEQRSKLQTVLIGSQDLIVVMDDEGRILLMNPSAAEAFRVDGKDARGQYLLEVADADALHELFQLPSTDSRLRNLEVSLGDGRTFYASLSPVAEVGWALIMRDISYLKQLDTMKSDFVATITHDLRSPLTVIHGALRLLPQLGQLNEEQNEFAQRATRSAEHMDRLISSLLDIGRIEAGLEMKMGPVELRDVVEQVVANLQEEAANKRQTVDLELADSVSMVKGNPTRLVQVITNLLDNAIRYTPEGGRIAIRASEDEGQITLSVSDTGVGIPAQAKDHIFQKFYRVEGPQTRELEGMGLGLAAVKSIVERHGGRVWVQSREGQGSIFYFTLPTVTVEAP
jgi:two-component system phosphate regulon sensor histidine kinase PhoR